MSSKAHKEAVGRNGIAGARRDPRAGLSQSLSFPAKGSLSSALRKSTATAKETKEAAKISANGSEITNGWRFSSLLVTFVVLV